ncbi:hypothetical protein NL676_024476 [Syzygium grande]|nr:hypothetical protein NL676_024476 [Syzygium grande]
MPVLDTLCPVGQTPRKNNPETHPRWPIAWEPSIRPPWHPVANQIGQDTTGDFDFPSHPVGPSATQKSPISPRRGRIEHPIEIRHVSVGGLWTVGSSALDESSQSQRPGLVGSEVA